MASQRDRIVLGISGASGAIYGVRLLQTLRGFDLETHLVVSKPGEMTLAYETPFSVADLRALADAWHPINDVGAAIASGSFQCRGMIIAPCSMRTLAEIASGVTSNLLTRAADVMLKERRRLVLMARESPLHAGHLRNMLTVTELGGIVAPPMPGFYAKPASLDDVIDHSVGRLLDLFDLNSERTRRWGDDGPQGIARTRFGKPD
ncbi:MAG: UbiX family flavin prenyltransferase [Geminicoccaceae bacterium]